jgi:tRNA-modifying protein YgfZ
MTTQENYRALKEKAVIGAIARRSGIGLTGGDRASYLHGLLTNDIQALTSGTGCYAAWLTPQGRMLTDLHIFESGDMMLVDVPADLLSVTLERLDQFLFSEDVQIADLSQTLAATWLHGPAAASVIEGVLTGISGLASWPEYRNARAEFDGAPVVVGCVSQLGVPGFVIYADPTRSAALQSALVGGGATVADPEVIEAARIEAGYPLFGADMTAETIPLEAGIEDRAISMTKGCYVGQEVIIRVLHRGQGRVAKRLVGLRIKDDQPDGLPASGARVFSDERDIGSVTSAGRSPNLGAIALGYVHRDFVSAGTELEVETPSGRVATVVSDRPMT